MDPVTHALAGGLVARTGIGREIAARGLRRRGVALGAIAAVAPDLDAIVELTGDPLAYLRYHRGATHSLLGGVIIAALLALVASRLFPGVRRRSLLAVALAGVYLHVFLDLTTSYGTMLLYPFSEARFTLDWLYIVDPMFTGILLAALTAGFFLRRAPARVAKVGAAVALGYVLLCGVLQLHARQALAAEARAHDIAGVVQVAALPAPFVPLNWTGIVETGDHYYQARIELAAVGGELTFEEVPKVAPRAQVDSLQRVASAGAQEQMRLYRWAARFPVVTVRSQEDGRVMEMQDLRFNLPGLGHDMRPFVFTVRLAPDGSVVETRLD